MFALCAANVWDFKIGTAIFVYRSFRPLGALTATASVIRPLTTVIFTCTFPYFTKTDGPVKLPFIAGGSVIEGAALAGACVAGAVATVFVPELFVATGLAFFVAAAAAFVGALALAEDDEAGALDVAPGPVTDPPAMFIALVVPN